MEEKKSFWGLSVTGVAVDPGENLMECPLCGKLSRSHSAMCILLCVQCALCSVHCAMCTVQCAFCSVCIVQCVQYALCTTIYIPLFLIVQELFALDNNAALSLKFAPLLILVELKFSEE